MIWLRGPKLEQLLDLFFPETGYRGKHVEIIKFQILQLDFRKTLNPWLEKHTSQNMVASKRWIVTFIVAIYVCFSMSSPTEKAYFLGA